MLPAILTAASLAISAGSAIAGHGSQRSAARENERQAEQARRLEVRDLTIRQVEEEIAAGRQVDAVRTQAQAAAGQVQASAAASGVRGTSLDALMLDLAASEGVTIDTIRDQAVLTIDQLRRMREGAAVRAENRIASVPRPSLMAPVLQIAGAAVDAYSMHRTLPRNRPMD